MKSYQRLSGVEYIMLVDDDPITNYVNQLLLEELGLPKDKIIVTHEVNLALKNIEKVQKSLTERQSALVIFLDINMPDKGGFEMLDAIEEMKLPKGQLHIYLLSSINSPRDQIKAEQYDIRGFIDKPLKEENVLEILDNIYKLIQQS
ncbi:response regulator [Porifericola rhodea]|uniref:response regulator n=1 Tax=Porifericola rhodea TaxID=930972 RepID=UPI002665E104|nr:response regulator [Porifericola rhodea]WKN33838.1 response regulator [Porifericola rhodea]